MYVLEINWNMISLKHIGLGREIRESEEHWPIIFQVASILT